MRIGRYRITRRGYLVFGAFGVLLLLLMAFIVKGFVIAPTSDQVTPDASQGSSVQSNSNNGNGEATGEASTEATGEQTESTGLSVSEINEVLGAAHAVVYFKPDSYEMDPSYYGVLDEIVNIAMRFKEAKILIDGHYNGYPDFKVTEFWTSLATNRAEMAEAYLVSQGIDQERIIINNLGCTVPVNKDDSWQEIEKNRRVEIHFELLK